MKQKGTIKLLGLDKKAGLVHYERKGKVISRARPEKGAHADNESMKQNSDFTPGINKLAGQITSVMKLYAEGFIEKGLYQRLTSAFFRVRHASRLVRLNAIEDFEPHRRNRLKDAIDIAAFSVVPAGEQLIINTSITRHANLVKDLKFYSLHIIMIFWTKDAGYVHAEKYTKWLDAAMKLPMRYTFPFDKPEGATDFLVMCCCLRGEEKNEKRLPPERALKVVAVGSFDKEAIAELETYGKSKSPAASEGARLIQRDEELGLEPDE